MSIKEYIDSIDTSLYPEGIIAAVLYDPEEDTHLYLFDFDYDEYGNMFCTMLNEPINKKLPYMEFTLPFIDMMDYYYGYYVPEKDSKDIGKHFKKVIKKLKAKERALLRH